MLHLILYKYPKIFEYIIFSCQFFFTCINISNICLYNTLWRDSIDLEMNTILPAFDLLLYGEKVPPGYVQLSGHIIFDVKIDFICKSRWVKDGYLIRDPIESNFAGVVSLESF